MSRKRKRKVAGDVISGSDGVVVPCDRCGVPVYGSVEEMQEMLNLWDRLGRDAASLYCPVCSVISITLPPQKEGVQKS